MAVILIICLMVVSLWAAFTTMDTDDPANTDSPTLGAQEIREFKTMIQERMNVDHYFPIDGNNQIDHADCGEHRQMTFQAGIAAPASAAAVLHSILDGAVAGELAYDDPAANNCQITKAGQLNITGDYTQTITLSNTTNDINTDALACTTAGTMLLPFDTVTAVEGQITYDDTADTVKFSNATPAWDTIMSALTVALSNAAYGSATNSATGLAVDVGFNPDLIIAWNEDGAAYGDHWTWNSLSTTKNKNISTGITEDTLRISVSGTTISFPYGTNANYPNRSGSTVYYFAFNFRAAVQNPSAL